MHCKDGKSVYLPDGIAIRFPCLSKVVVCLVALVVVWTGGAWYGLLALALLVFVAISEISVQRL